jgi:hypothetical protein
MRIPKIPGFKRHRKYPIKRDEYGKTVRQWCFQMFEDEVPLQEIIESADVPRETVYKYQQQWLKNPHLETQISYMKDLLDKKNPQREETVELFAILMGVDKETIEAKLLESHGLQRILTGKIVFPASKEAYFKRSMSLSLGMLFADYLIKDDIKFEDFIYALDKWLKVSQENRKEETKEIKHDNERTQFIRKLLEAVAEGEKAGRPIRESLTAEERNAFINLGLKGLQKKTERKYWEGVAVLMQEGLTPEQAREKIYQDTLAQADPKTATDLRAFQDKVHPLKPKPITPMTADDPKPSSDKNIPAL